MYANGGAINTSSWVRSHLGVVFAAVVAVPLVLALVFVSAMRLVFRRRARTRGAATPT